MLLAIFIFSISTIVRKISPFEVPKVVIYWVLDDRIICGSPPQAPKILQYISRHPLTRGGSLYIGFFEDFFVKIDLSERPRGPRTP